MNPTTDQTNYLAFISYRHADNTEEDRQWATWLHQQLEVYDIPADLIGSTNQRGEIIPERIYPVFRDEISLPADSNLASAITTALDNSNFLIVLCSPRSVQSQYVNDEILYFKQIGKKDRIMAALLLGEPNASIDDAKEEDPEDVRTLECFPKALQYHLKENGELDTTSRTEPIAANFRLPDGSKGLTHPNVYKQQLLKQGRNKKDATRLSDSYEEQLNNAKLKIIAGILGVQLEQLTQRDKIFQLNKARAASKRFMRIAVIMGVLSMAALAATGFAYTQWQQAEQAKQRAEQEKHRAEEGLTQIRKSLNFMNFALRDVMDAHVPQHKRIKIVRQIDAIVAVLEQHDNQSLEGQRLRAVALLQKSEQVLKNDKLDPKDALPLAQQGLELFKKLSQQDPGNTGYQRSLSVSYEKLGNIQLRLGNTQAALTHYQTSLELRKKLSLQDPDNTGYQRDLSVSYNKLGDIQLRLGNTQAALTHYQTSLELRKKLSQQDPDNTGVQRSLSVSYEKLGNIQLRLGNTQAALTHYQASFDIFKKLSLQDPDNTGVQRGLSVSYSKLGNIQLRLGDTQTALTHYQTSLELHKKLSLQDPDNTGYQRDLSVSYNKLGNIQLRLGNTQVALTHYQASFDIFKKLSQQDPDNTGYQRSLSVSYNKLGDIQLRLGDSQVALTHYQASLELDKKLSLQDPDNTGYQRDLSVSYNKLGDIQRRLGETQAALTHYQASLDLRKKLSLQAPANSQYQQDLIYSYDKIARAFSALEHYQKAIYYKKQIIEFSAENSDDAINALGSIGWYQLLSGDFKDARASSLKAYTQKPTSFAWGINLAHTYWLHQKDEQRAKAQFLEVLPKIKDNEYFQQGPKADFKIFAEKGWCPQDGLCQKLEKWLDVEWQKELKSR